jgi:beta propeller repeat protein
MGSKFLGNRLIILLFILLGLSGIALYLSYQQITAEVITYQQVGYRIKETRLTNALMHQENPVIDQNKVIWVDNRNNQTNLYLYDLNNGQETLLTDGTQVPRYPSINGDRVVWEDYRDFQMSDFNADIYWMDLNTRKEAPVTTAPGPQSSPYIYQDKIVWMDQRSDLDIPNIYLYDLTSLEETQITTQQTLGLTAINDNKIVYVDSRSNLNLPPDSPTLPLDLFIYDLLTKKEDRLTSITVSDQGDCDNEVALSLFGDKVVWQDFRDGNSEIYLYDRTNGQVRRITNNPKSQCSPIIYGDKIVWQDNRSSNWDIYLYDLTLNQEFQVTSNIKDQTSPAIYENKIVWSDARDTDPNYFGGRSDMPGSNINVYLAELSLDTITVNPTPTPTISAKKKSAVLKTKPSPTPTPTPQVSPPSLTLLSVNIIYPDQTNRTIKAGEQVVITNDDKLSFKGRTSPDGKVSINIETASPSTNEVMPNADGFWEYTLNPQMINIDKGKHTVNAMATNSQGQKSEVVALSSFELKFLSWSESGQKIIYIIIVAILSLAIISITLLIITRKNRLKAGSVKPKAKGLLNKINFLKNGFWPKKEK